jgi:hypothetical protein
MSIWTPYQINIVLHYHCSPGPWPLWTAPIFAETVGALVSDGLLEPSDDGMRPTEAHCYRTTERGKALVEFWCATPMPQPMFVDPRFFKELFQ